MIYSYKYIFFILSMIFLASCTKENLDTDVTMEDEVVVEVVSCTVDVALEENIPGELRAAITDGVAPFTYNWSTGETTENIIVDVSGIYTLMVVDAEGCIAESAIEFSEDACSGFSVEIGLTMTHLAVVDHGGTAPFSYSWSNGETVGYIPLDGSDEYEVTVTDYDGCITTEAIDVTIPCAGFIPILFHSDVNGDVGAEIVGGVAPYLYEWNTGDTTQSIVGPVDSGTYIVTITDANGCVETRSIVVP